MTGRPALAALAAAGLACGAGGPTPAGTPSTRPPLEPGEREASLTYVRATPADHCFARWLETEGRGAGHSFRAAARIQREGGTVRGALRGLDIPMTCEFEGTVDGVAVRWRHTGCSLPCTTFSHPALACPALRVCTVDQRFEGLDDGAQLAGALAVSWDATERDSGLPRGRVDIEGSLRVRR